MDDLKNYIFDKSQTHQEIGLMFLKKSLQSTNKDLDFFLQNIDIDPKRDVVINLIHDVIYELSDLEENVIDKIELISKKLSELTY